MANLQLYKQYLSAAPTRIFRRDWPITASDNPYVDSLQMCTDRIREFNAKFIRDKSGLQLASVLKFTLKMVKYAPPDKRGWTPFSALLSKKEAIINIWNNDEHC